MEEFKRSKISKPPLISKVKTRYVLAYTEKMDKARIVMEVFSNSFPIEENC
jgi:hypothetical protein